MPKLPVFTAKPIKGLKQKDWGKETLHKFNKQQSNYSKTGFLRLNKEKVYELAKPFTNTFSMTSYKGENEKEINAAGRYFVNNSDEFPRPEWFDEVIINKWTKENVIKDIKTNNYSSRQEFGEKNQPAYQAAQRYKLLDEFFPKYKSTKKKFKYTDEDLTNMALQFNVKLEFMKAYPGPYEAARLRGILNDICSHMKSNRGRPKK